MYTGIDAFSFARFKDKDATLARGRAAFVKARCNQCHVVAGHGINLGPDLTESVKTLKGAELPRPVLEPSSKIHEKFQNHQFITIDGRVITGVIVNQTDDLFEVATRLLTPNTLTTIPKPDVDERFVSKISPMPPRLLNVLTREEILDLLAYLENGDFRLPDFLRKQHVPSTK